MSKSYFSVISCRSGETKWHPQFGDYKRSVAEDECRDMKEGEKRMPRAERSQFRVVRSGDTQADIEAKCLEIENALATGVSK